MSIPQPVVDYHVEQKSWGWEKWIVNNDLYCGKILYFRQGKHSSMHFHRDKHETMYCLKGRFVIRFIDTKTGLSEEVFLLCGDSVVIPPCTVHEIMGLDPDMNELLEVSTHHENADSYRVGEPG